jgi:hypothetical protein
VQLIPCPRPDDELEAAPPTSLRRDTALERWDGFWSVASERYYARCTQRDGSERWYRVADELRGDDTDGSGQRALSVSSGIGWTGAARVGPMRWFPGRRRPILVGTLRRRPRAAEVGR